MFTALVLLFKNVNHVSNVFLPPPTKLPLTRVVEFLTYERKVWRLLVNYIIMYYLAHFHIQQANPPVLARPTYYRVLIVNIRTINIKYTTLMFPLQRFHQEKLQIVTDIELLSHSYTLFVWHIALTACVGLAVMPLLVLQWNFILVTEYYLLPLRMFTWMTMI